MGRMVVLGCIVDRLKTMETEKITSLILRGNLAITVNVEILNWDKGGTSETIVENFLFAPAGFMTLFN